MTEIDVIDEEGQQIRSITASNISWMLVTGWMFYMASVVLNFIYYNMHPSFPEMWTWGKEEKLEEWTLPPADEPKTQEKGEF